MIPLAQNKLDEAQQHALQEYPFECCGIIIGRPDSDREDILFRCTNIQNKLHEMDPGKFVRDARTAFYIDPKELMGILKETETRKLAIKLFYHSHPEHDAYRRWIIKNPDLKETRDVALGIHRSAAGLSREAVKTRARSATGLGNTTIGVQIANTPLRWR